jgi:hypothetical protein
LADRRYQGAKNRVRKALRRVQSDCSGSKEVLRVTWIADLGAPKESGVYEVRGLQVRVSERSTSKELTRNSLPGVQM